MKPLVLILLGALGLVSCDSEDDYLPAPSPLEIAIPANFPPVQYNLSSNPPTEEGFALGKALFYDGRLSSNGAISCGFCHIQAFAFTHHGHTVSHGVNGGQGFRNAQPLQNLAFFKEFTWDGAATHLELQPIIPITSEVEMNETLPNILEKLRNTPHYPTLFARAFGDTDINAERLLKALAQFMVALVSGNSKYDQHLRGEGVSLSPQEAAGLRLFQDKCATCHAGTLLSDQTYRNNGLPLNARFPDEVGRMRVTGRENDFYKFRVPSLRNVARSFPYMHDGRFGTLEDVLDFYSHGLQDNGNVDPLLQQGAGSLGIALSEEEKENIIAFLNTLTDEEFIQDPRFSE